jgi:hypothetical protein
LSESETSFAAPRIAPTGRDEPFWVPSMAQALAMARASGRSIFVMGYSLVGRGCPYETYRKLDREYLTDAF